jgi:amino acid transporter
VSAEAGFPTEPGRRLPFKRALLGRPIPIERLQDELLPKLLALPIFASDALSSVAYATEAALAVLVAASLASANLVVPISAAIAALLAIVVLSYRETINAYPNGGGAYVVARENLGTTSGLVAAASLLVDYVLTVAVSIVAGVLALASAVPGLQSHEVALSLLVVVVLALANLRGVREAGLLFALPTYGFVAAMLVMVVVGIVGGVAGGWPSAHVPDALPTGTAATVGLVVVLRAFASGCSALTGVEAVSNGVTAFRRPQAQNASRTLLIMGAIAITLFMGVSVLADKIGARPSGSVSVLSEVARAVFPAGSASAIGFYLVQGFTFGILILAANTAYQGFPRLAALLARDGFVPRQFSNLGDRLVFSNGLIVLSLLAALLIVAFNADINGLIHLYLLGVFTAFTLSQAGMVRLWWRRRGKVRSKGPLLRSLSLNALGAVSTALVTLVIVFTKFREGAWMVMVAVPAIVVLFLLVRRHYERVHARLSTGFRVAREGRTRGPVIVVVQSLDDATTEALRYARAVAGTRYRALHVADPGAPGIMRAWPAFSGGDVQLEVVPRNGSVAGSIVRAVRATEHGDDQYVTVLVPEFFARRSWLVALRGRTGFALKLRLLREAGVVTTDIPVVAGSEAVRRAPAAERRRTVVITPVSGTNDASLRAIDYALALHGDETRGLSVALDAQDAKRLRAAWEYESLPLPLDIVESPFRDIGGPLLRSIREVTADPDAVCVVVMPELIVSHWWERILHNQRALYLKRLLLFEERVILASVPYRL